MSDLSDTLKRNRLIEDGEPVEGEITDITGAALFNSGWIGMDFLYEIPTIFITCETDFGEVQLEQSFRNLKESGLEQLLNAYNPLESPFSLESLIGEKVYLALGPERNFVSIGPDYRVHYTKDSNLVFRSGDNVKDFSSIFNDNGRFATGYEERSLRHLTEVLEMDYMRAKNNNYGWVPATFEYAGISDDEHTFTASISDGLSACWKFEDTFDDLSEIEDFLTTLGINYTPQEFDSTEQIWVKPLNDAHYSNRPATSQTVISENEYWLASSAPLKEKKAKSFLERVKKKFSFPKNKTLDVSSSSRTNRRAKSSKRHKTEQKQGSESSLSKSESAKAKT
jgi:hypothetical protein